MIVGLGINKLRIGFKIKFKSTFKQTSVQIYSILEPLFQSIMILTLGFSPCPNDTFIFDALVNKRIDTEGIDFKVFMLDVETLNKKALHAELDITKLSFAALAKVQDKYDLLDSGSALGFGVGPLVISKEKDYVLNKNSRVAIPGELTTAHFLFRLFYPEVILRTEMVFSEIENAVISGVVDAGVIIHENRFTYQLRGLHKVRDLGEAWESERGLPIPLGGIAIKKELSSELKHKVNELIKKSVNYAFLHPDASEEFVKNNAQEMDANVRRQHIALYVNKYSLSLGDIGSEAVRALFLTAKDKKLLTTNDALEIII